MRALFDRSERRGELLKSLKDARVRIRSSFNAELHRAHRSPEVQWQALRANDFFPGQASQKAADTLAEPRQEIERHLSPDEPTASSAAIPVRAIADYQVRAWAARKRPWLDRLATAWLVQRIIDQRPRFIWLSDLKKLPARPRATTSTARPLRTWATS